MSGKVWIGRLPLLGREWLLGLSAWLFQEKEEIPLTHTLIDKCFCYRWAGFYKLTGILWHFVLNITKIWVLRTLKQTLREIGGGGRYYSVFQAFFFFFLNDAPWTTIMKAALTEVDRVSFSAHPYEWMGFSQLLVQKAVAADVSVFLALVCFVHTTGSSYSSAWLQRAQIMLTALVVLPCLFLLTDRTWSIEKKKKRGERNASLIYFLITTPSVHKDSVMFRQCIVEVWKFL